MKSREYIENWLIKNALNANNQVDLSGLKFGYYTVNLSGISGDKIYNNNQRAITVIDNGLQQVDSGKIINADQEANQILNQDQKIKQNTDL